MLSLQVVLLLKQQLDSVMLDNVVSIVDRQVNNEATEFMNSSGLKLTSLYQLQDILDYWSS